MELEQLEGNKMKKSITYIGLLFIMGLLTGCPGAIDSLVWKELGNGYIYHEPAGIPTIGKSHGDKGIPGWVFRYNFNADFILALEKDIELSEEEREKLIIKGDFYDFVFKNGYSKFWIISHENDSIYGPFDKQEYLQKRLELGVPVELELKSY
jgi:hypothetical protein